MSDTLVIDSVQIAQWQAQEDFDYNRELVDDGTSFTQWLMLRLDELINDIIGEAAGNAVVQWLLVGVGVGVLGLIAWYIWRYHPGLFMLQEHEGTDYGESEDNIYGVDFDTALSRTLGQGNYREAIRLLYLQTLKHLSDAQLIDWQLYKTPTQYVREFSTSGSGSSGGAAVASFRTLTTHFLRIRYGNFPANRELYDELSQLGKEVRGES